MTELLHHFQSITRFSQKSWEFLQPALEAGEVSKNGYLLKTGEVCQSLFFILKGSCRSFYIHDGEEINTAFYFETEFATNIKSLTLGMPSEYAIQACERMSVIKIDRLRLLDAYRQSSEIESLGRTLLEAMMVKQEEHANLFKLLTPQQRYNFLEKNQPSLLQKISLTQLSSYLGISRETLSRIRRRNTKN